MRIFDLEEYNCIMRHAVKEEAGIWYWTDGNDVANTGVWVHAFDNSEVSFSHTQSTAALKIISVTLVERHLLSILAAQEKIEEITAMTLQPLSTCSFASLISFELIVKP